MFILLLQRHRARMDWLVLQRCGMRRCRYPCQGQHCIIAGFALDLPELAIFLIILILEKSGSVRLKMSKALKAGDP